MTKIIFIGAGNLATNLATAMQQKGFEIVQIYSHTVASAEKLAATLNCSFTNVISEIRTDADLYIFSVKDAALSSVLEEMQPNHGLWVHTAGSIPMDTFRPFTPRYGVFYPLQTFSKVRLLDFSDIPFFIEAHNEADCRLLTEHAEKLSAKVYAADSEQRKYLHLAAVFACNFTNHMYAIAAQLTEQHGVPFDALHPLIAETASKIRNLAPSEAQTGPAVRYDRNVMNKHLDLLHDESLQQIYKDLSDSIFKFSNNK
ncbi:MAG: DUF2520 domain-containing protein [Bacteroidales bacterium]